MKLLSRNEHEQYGAALADGWSSENLTEVFSNYRDDERVVYPGLGIVLKHRRIIFYKDTRTLTLWPTDVPAVCAVDGSGTIATKPAGCGIAIFRPDRDPTYLAKNIGLSSNNRAELSAVGHALRFFNLLDQEILILTDSAYTIGVLSKGHQASANAELVAVIRQDLALRPSVTFEHVYGHEGNEANEIADKMANIGRKYVTKITPIL